MLPDQAPKSGWREINDSTLDLKNLSYEGRLELVLSTSEAIKGFRLSKLGDIGSTSKKEVHAYVTEVQFFVEEARELAGATEDNALKARFFDSISQLQNQVSLLIYKWAHLLEEAMESVEITIERSLKGVTQESRDRIESLNIEGFADSES